MENGCNNDDSTGDKGGYTCSSFYDLHPNACGDWDTDSFTASVQCCACKALDTGGPPGCTDHNVGQEWQSEDRRNKCICRGDGSIGCTDSSTGLLVLGGTTNGSSDSFSSVEYVPLTGGPDSCATSVPDLPTTVPGPSIITTEGLVLNCGGFTTRMGNIASNECYSWTWASQNWTSAPTLPTRLLKNVEREKFYMGDDFADGTKFLKAKRERCEEAWKACLKILPEKDCHERNLKLAVTCQCEEACKRNKRCLMVDNEKLLHDLERDMYPWERESERKRERLHCELLIESKSKVKTGLEGGQMVVSGDKILWIGGPESSPLLEVDNRRLSAGNLSLIHI